MLQVSKSVTVKRPREEVYRFWRNLENLPGFMYHVEAVSVTGDRSHWIVKAPGGTVEWDAEIVEEQPGERFTWRSLSGSEVHHHGSVRFRDAPADRGTEVDVELQYDAPGGSAGAMLAKLFGEIRRLEDRGLLAAADRHEANHGRQCAAWYASTMSALMRPRSATS